MVPHLSGGWACGAGHILANRITYNTALDKWGRVCWVDADTSGGDEFPSQRGPGGEHLYYSMVAGSLGGLSHLKMRTRVSTGQIRSPPTTPLPTTPPPTCHIQRQGRPDSRDASSPALCIDDFASAKIWCCSTADPR